MSLSIELFTEDDIPHAMQLVEQAGWNQLPADWHRVLGLAPNGCFVARLDGTLAGTVTTICYGTDLAWIGMMLVDHRLRRLGIGRRLMERAIAELQSRSIRSIQLDATPVGKTLYDQLGFRTELAFHRWHRPGNASNTPHYPNRSTGDSQGALAENHCTLDRVTFGAHRSELLARLAESSQAVTCPDGSFGLLRAGRIADYLGPISATEQSAAPIVSELTARTDRDLFWDIPSQNTGAVYLATLHGFSPVRTLFRMTIGSAPTPHWATMFALADPALG
ncbi:putative acetyltransferase [Pirellula sp. SH-Sr6A]|uniref:GNAT family N-acetyltransferase n=1 Tax=Pirellula sp. SH-Sr6A TaxID=1632865 RepID=UPI00078DEB09|nr:GNAT family N-acetyltransferase [Pirellula sp. SH-Sr6A]AMV34795.1 putative acetyltransferase [Pirellula sp. SH-Sr6A]